MTHDRKTIDHQSAQIARFARDNLGPSSEQYATAPAVQVLVMSRLRNGFDLEDAVLAEVHSAATKDRLLADEFVAFFLNDLLRIGHRIRPAAIHRFLDTGDLVQSVLGDLWADLSSVQYQTRGRFLSYFARRMRWKSSDRVRHYQSGKRMEDQRADLSPEEMKADAPSPMASAISAEEQERLAVALVRLPERDRRILTLHLQERTLTEIGAELGCSRQTARTWLQRAMRKARRICEARG